MNMNDKFNRPQCSQDTAKVTSVLTYLDRKTASGYWLKILVCPSYRNYSESSLSFYIVCHGFRQAKTLSTVPQNSWACPAHWSFRCCLDHLACSHSFCSPMSSRSCRLKRSQNTLRLGIPVINNGNVHVFKRLATIFRFTRADGLMVCLCFIYMFIITDWMNKNLDSLFMGAVRYPFGICPEYLDIRRGFPGTEISAIQAHIRRFAEFQQR